MRFTKFSRHWKNSSCFFLFANMWKFALVLAAVHGASCIALSIYWVLETLKCSEHRVIVSPNNNLVETPEVLDQMCKQQDEFFRCLENLASLMEPASVELSSKIANERSVFNSLCSAESPWRRRYLELAPCINLQQTDFCKTPEFLGADGTDIGSPAVHVKEKMENCIAATLSMKCGIEAGQLFHYLLKLKSDISQPVEMTDIHSDPSSNVHPSAKSAFGDISDQLVKKIGYIPEQDSADSFVLHKREGHMHEEWESVDENISSSLEIENMDPYSHFVEQDGSENVEHSEYENDGPVSSTLDTVDETSDDLPKNAYIIAHFNDFCLNIQSILSRRDDLITQYNGSFIFAFDSIFVSERTLKPEEKYETVRIFPDGRINYYSRRTDIQDLETIKCYNFPDYFVCINNFRTVLPRCLQTTDFTGPREGEFFPEEFDPEFGVQWYETIPNEAYLFESWVHKSIADASVHQSYASVVEHAETRHVPVDSKESKDMDADAHIVSKDALSIKIMKDSDAHEFTTKDNKSETIINIFKVFTTAMPLTSKIEIKNILPKNIVEALTNLYESKRVSFGNVKIRLDHSGNLYIFWNNQQESVIDTITCGKVNECHRKAEGIWKCVIVPKPNVEPDGLDLVATDE